ncbi:MAG: 3D domain-containing protein [Acidobacteriota bacterium]|nr:3D domain-containing protein [Blastocatellia bacterium]MDW8413495.1 3D domain-containing protein [Acidobacteriota bacterium]
MNNPKVVELLRDYSAGITGFLLSFGTCLGTFAYYELLDAPKPPSQTPPVVAATTIVTATANLQPQTMPKKKKVNRLKAGKSVYVEATAYCLNSKTSSGVRSNYGILAADPKVLPIGSVVKLQADEYTGLYTVLDTGKKIKGHKIDIYLANHKEAMNFGRRKVKLKVLRYGWNPQSMAEQRE